MVNIKDYLEKQHRLNKPNIESAASDGNRNWKQTEFLFNKVPNNLWKTLDLGCGDGYWSKRLLEKSIEVVGVDIIPQFIKLCGRFKNTNLNYQTMDMHQMSFSNNTFDLVYADNSIEHCHDPEMAFSEIYRILKTDGLIMALIPLDGIVGYHGKDTAHFWRPRTLEEVKLIMSRFFEIIEIDVYNCYENWKVPHAPSNNLVVYVKAQKTTAIQAENASERMKKVITGHKVVKNEKTQEYPICKQTPHEYPMFKQILEDAKKQYHPIDEWGPFYSRVKILCGERCVTLDVKAIERWVHQSQLPNRSKLRGTDL